LHEIRLPRIEKAMGLPNFVRYTLSPLALILFTPLLIVIFNYIIQELNGSLADTWTEIQTYGPYQFIVFRCILNNLPTLTHFSCIFAFYLSQIVLYYVVPGASAYGPATSTGYVPRYKENGVACYVVSNALVLIAYFAFNAPVHELFHHLTPVIIAVCIISWIVTFALMFGALCCPTNVADVHWNSNPVLSYWRGWELYPYWFGINCKQLINSRIGMTQWALICLVHILKDFDNMKQLSGGHSPPWTQVLCSPVFISGALQIVYLLKFFWWEIGYFGTLDVMHDRCGFYISWGCLSWVFSVYTLHTGILLAHKLRYSQSRNEDAFFTMSAVNAAVTFVVGLLSIYINYEADAQKIRVRKANGKCNVFGKPAEIIRAKYKTKGGKKKESLLLVSGYWGFARHFHYVPELLFALMICVPSQLASSLQLFYFVYLTILLCDRTGRDDQRCSEKYGTFWKQYCSRVQYKMVPFIW